VQTFIGKNKYSILHYIICESFNSCYVDTNCPFNDHTTLICNTYRNMSTLMGLNIYRTPPSFNISYTDVFKVGIII